jgi:O-antigen ligase
LGTALTLPIGFLFVLALSVHKPKVRWLGAGFLMVVALVGGLLLHKQIVHFIVNWHTNTLDHVSTWTKRYYLWWTALDMIRDHVWLGVGPDNWLCHYQWNNICPLYSSSGMKTYIIGSVPGTNNKVSTGLFNEATLSHPHDVFLHVWVSLGIFGLLAFLAILVLFFWLFARLYKTVRTTTHPQIANLEWLVLGFGGAMLTAMCQGLVDSAFLEQDLAFCFWAMLVALLILRILTGIDWRFEGHRKSPSQLH